MSIESVLAFRGRVAGNPELEAKVRTCIETGQGFAGLTALGAEHGFRFTEGEISAAFVNDDSELSDFELEMVSAGVPCNTGTNGGGGWGK